jgi:hypothetical protein
MTEPSALVDPMHNQEAHMVDAAVHRPQRVSLFGRLLKTRTVCSASSSSRCSR